MGRTRPVAVARTVRHRTCSSGMKRAPVTLGTWQWEGTSFRIALDCGTKILGCRPMVYTAQENTHLPEHSQPPLPVCSSLAPGELHLLCKSGSKANVTGFLLNPDEAWTSTGWQIATLPFSRPCCPHPSRAEAVGAGATIPPVFP